MPRLFETDSDREACGTALRAGSKSFATASRLLPKAVRDPAVALYAFCREADDVIDGGGDDLDRGARGLAGLSGAGLSGAGLGRAGLGRAGLDWLRERLDLAYQGRPLPLPADRAFAQVVDRFAIPRCLPEALLEGFAWDAEGRRYADLPALRAYAVRVAGTVGAMMAVLMGVRDRGRLAAAIDLGVAMQLSNIARDVGEDAANGRLYLPLDWMAEAGIDPDRFMAAPAHSVALAGVVGRLLQTAQQHYRDAGAGITRLPMNCRLGIGAAGLLYWQIGQEVGRRGMDAVSARAVVSSRRKAWVLATGLTGMMLPLRPLTGACVPEGGFLVDAVVRSSPRPIAASASLPWWALADRVRWTIDLFERLERQERVQL